MNISVIIPCRNEKRNICEFLDSLLLQDLPPAWGLEILVADGLSDDGTRELVRHYSERDSPIRVIDNPGRIVSTGLNAAIGAATGDIIIRMDAHTTYARDYIRECVRALQESGADNVGGPWIAEGRGYIGKAIAAAFHSRFCTGGGKAHDPAYKGEVDTVYLGCWHRSIFTRIGLFDPCLVRNQDDEWNFRLRRMGGRVWQSPLIRSSYTARDSVSGLFRQYLQYGFWKVAAIRKHRALASWRHVVPALFVGSIPLALALIALGAAFGMSGLAFALGVALAAELSVYLLGCIAASLSFARVLPWRSLLILPGVIAVYHFAYGLGFLAGIVKFALHGSGAAAPSRFFTALTR